MDPELRPDPALIGGLSDLYVEVSVTAVTQRLTTIASRAGHRANRTSLSLTPNPSTARVSATRSAHRCGIREMSCSDRSRRPRLRGRAQVDGHPVPTPMRQPPGCVQGPRRRPRGGTRSGLAITVARRRRPIHGVLTASCRWARGEAVADEHEAQLTADAEVRVWGVSVRLIDACASTIGLYRPAAGTTEWCYRSTAWASSPDRRTRLSCGRPRRVCARSVP